MEPVTQIQILDVTVNVSLSFNVRGKVMNPSLLSNPLQLSIKSGGD